MLTPRMDNMGGRLFIANYQNRVNKRLRSVTGRGPWVMLRHMTNRDLLAQIGEKGTDPEVIAQGAIERPALIPELIAGLGARQARTKYGCEKVLRRISEKKPALVYPYFDTFAELLQEPNNILRWGAIMILANLASVDSRGKIEELFSKYCAFIAGPVMITAANVIGSLPRIAKARPEMAERISREIIKVETATYELHGCPSPECRNVAIGHAVAALGEIFESIEKKKPVLEFVTRQLKNGRASVRKAAAVFLTKHGTAG